MASSAIASIPDPHPGGAAILAVPNPFSDIRITGVMPEGWTIDEIVGHIAHHHGISPAVIPLLRVYIKGTDGSVSEVPWAMWDAVRPKRSAQVIISGRQGKGGGGGKSPIKIVATIAIMVVANWAAGALLEGTLLASQLNAAMSSVMLPLGFTGPTIMATTQFLVSGVISLALNSIVNAIIPTSSPANRGQSWSPSPISAPSFAITGIGNRENRYGPIPVVAGRNRVYPVIAARQYTEVNGSDQYIRAIFCFGYGPLNITDIKIGETPIDAFSGVEYEVRQGYPADTPITIYSRAVRQDGYNILLTNAGSWNQRRTRTNTTEISVDIGFLSGLCQFSQDGKRTNQTVEVAVEYSVAGAASWISAGTITTTDAKSAAVRNSLTWTVSEGQYDVRLRRVTADATDAQYVDRVHWTAMRSVKNEHPINKTGLALLAIKVKATEQLDGYIDSLNAICTSILPVWDGATWSEEETRNPAWAFCNVLRGPANAQPVDDDSLDLDSILEWAQWCDANSPQADGPMLRYDAVFDGKSTADQCLREIAAAGRARYVPSPTAKYSIVRDVEQVTCWGEFTPRNTANFQMERKFVNRPHGLKVRWKNPDAGYQEDEFIVYADGYDETNATLFEQFDMLYCTSSQQAWREARYHMAVAQLRPGTYTFDTDVEGRLIRPGDLIRYTHYTALWGVGSGRIRSVTLNGSNEATHLQLDNTVSMTTGNTYVVRVRLSDGTSITADVVTVDDDVSELEMVTPIPAANVPAQGDMYAFGKTGEEATRLIVRSVVAGENMSCRVEAVDEAPAIHTSYEGTIPAYTSSITAPIEPRQKRPNAPAIENIRSDESVIEILSDGTLQERMIVDIAPPAQSDVPIDAIYCQYRIYGTETWTSLPSFDAGTLNIAISPITPTAIYEVRLKSVSRWGVSSEWSATVQHTAIGRTSLPPDPDSATIAGSILSWVYSSAPVDHWGFRVKHRAGTSANWSDATSAHLEDVIATQSLDVSSLIGGGARVLMVKSVDTGGRESEGYVSVYVNLGDALEENITETRDYEAENFPGTLTGGALSGTDLIADDDGGLYLVDDNAPYLPDGDADYLPTSYSAMTWETSFIPEEASLPGEVLVIMTAEGVWNLQYKTHGSGVYIPGDDDAYLPDDDADYLEADSGWLAWPGYLALTGREEVGFKFSTMAGDAVGKLLTFVTKINLETTEESLDDVSISADGTRLPTTKTWRTIKNVSLTLQDDGGNADSVKAMDKSTAGPLVKCFASGVATTGLIDARIQGVLAA